MVPLRKHWESTSVIGCSVFVVNHDWLQLQLQSKMAEVLTQSGPQVVFHTPRNIKVASCLILIVTIHGTEELSLELMDVNEKQFTIASNLSSYSLIHEKNTKIFVYETYVDI